MKAIARLEDYRTPHKVSTQAALNRYASLIGAEYRLTEYLGRISTDATQTRWMALTVADFAAQCLQSNGQPASPRWITYVLKFLVEAGILERRGKNGCKVEWRVRLPADWADPDTLPALRKAIYPGCKPVHTPTHSLAPAPRRKGRRSNVQPESSSPSQPMNNVRTHAAFATKPVVQATNINQGNRKTTQPAASGDPYLSEEVKLPAVRIYEEVFGRQTIGRLDNLFYDIGATDDPQRKKRELQFFFEVCVMGLENYYSTVPPNPRKLKEWWESWLRDPSKRRAPINAKQYFADREAAKQARQLQGHQHGQQQTIFDVLGADEQTSDNHTAKSDAQREAASFKTEFYV